MLLKIKRSQRKGLMGKVVFGLDIRAEYSAEEKSNINNYSLGGEVVYSSEAAKAHSARASEHLEGGGLARGLMSMALASMKLNVTIASLQKGHHIECKDMAELLEAEAALREAAKNLTTWLDTAASFDGHEIVIEYANGQEKHHRPESTLG